MSRTINYDKLGAIMQRIYNDRYQTHMAAGAAYVAANKDAIARDCWAQVARYCAELFSERSDEIPVIE